MKTNANKCLSMRMITLISFIIFLVTTVFIISYITFSNWSYSIEKQIKDLAEEINQDTNYQITDFINIPQEINEYHQKYIQNGILNIDNDDIRDKFFVSALQQAPDYVYSLSYGTPNGEYYGARYNKSNEIEIIKNNQSTNGQTWIYQVKDNMTAGLIIKNVGKFDPRIQDWYIEAIERNDHNFSSVYQHYELDDLTISASLPVYVDGKLHGVLGTHIKLSYINDYLEDIVNDECFVVIIEKDTQDLVANSLNINNFITKDNGSYVRTKLNMIENDLFAKAYTYYQKNQINQFKFKHHQYYYFTFNNYDDMGLNWIVICGVPARLFTFNITKALYISLLSTILFVILSIIVYYIYSRKLFQPFYTLIESIEKIASGDFKERLIYNRNDEFGKICNSFNNMAGTISLLIDDLERKVNERTQSLSISNQELKENKERLQLILDSTVEAIYGVDNDGKCTFINISGLNILGYSSQDELLGKQMHYIIHHSTKDGRPMELNDCKIYQSLRSGKGVKVDNEVFWRMDGTCFDVEYNSYPQFKDGKIVGAVVTFVDVTDKKKSEEKIRYLSYYDSLTGLYNRNAFKEKLEELDCEENLPLTIIFGDVNGLKLTNDIFGHTAGDNLLKKTAEILKKVLREKDIISRYAGDEFVIALPNTTESEAEMIVQKIRGEFALEDTIAMMASISLGYETKTMMSENIIQTIDDAEAWMYKDKMDKRKTTNIETINKILTLLHKRSPQEKVHSLNVSLLCYDLAIAMGKSETEIRKCKDAGYFHDIGKIVVDPELLNYRGQLSDEQHKILEQHTVVGYRILNLFDETLDLAEGVLYHHEKWNGQGYPKGLKGEEIPELARLIKVVENYDFLVNRKNYLVEDALAVLIEEAGINYDPYIVDVFVKMIKEKNRYKNFE